MLCCLLGNLGLIAALQSRKKNIGHINLFVFNFEILRFW